MDTFEKRYLVFKLLEKISILDSQIGIMIRCMFSIFSVFTFCFFNSISVNYNDLTHKKLVTYRQASKGDTIKNSCHQFKTRKTANEYFESGNNRTKGCWPNDSLTVVAAVKDFSSAVKLNPRFWQARRNLARQLIILKQYNLAIIQLSKALNLVTSSSNPDLNIMRGNAFYENGDFQKAIFDFDIAMRYSGNNDFLLLMKAKALWNLGQTELACKTYKKSVGLDSNLAKQKDFIQCK